MDVIAYVPSRGNDVRFSHLPEGMLANLISKNGPVGKAYPIYFFAQVTIESTEV